MMHSGCFDRWRVRIATAVCWYYRGAGGEFTYWPEGWDGDMVTVKPPYNYGVMGDNDYMPHRVESIGAEADYAKYGFDATITLTPDRQWVIEEPGREPVRHTFDEVRVSLSWKAFVFDDAHEAEVYDRHLDDLDEPTLIATMAEDCGRRGVTVPDGPDALARPEFGERIRAAYLSPELRF